MSKSTIEELIESAKDKKHLKYLRLSWAIAARSKLIEADEELRKLEEELLDKK